MSVYSDNYNKALAGYNKIKSCIESCTSLEHLEGVQKIINGWLEIVGNYAEEIFCDKSIGGRRKRKKAAEGYSQVITTMFSDIKSNFENKNMELIPEDYESAYKPVRIRSIQEYNEPIGENFSYDNGSVIALCDTSDSE